MTDGQDPIAGIPQGAPVRRWCKGWRCGRELTDPVSRMRGYGPECDPEHRTGASREHVIDQEPLPGM
jgi:hypothetical protein